MKGASEEIRIKDIYQENIREESRKLRKADYLCPYLV